MFIVKVLRTLSDITLAFTALKTNNRLVSSYCIQRNAENPLDFIKDRQIVKWFLLL